MGAVLPFTDAVLPFMEAAVLFMAGLLLPFMEAASADVECTQLYTDKLFPHANRQAALEVRCSSSCKVLRHVRY